MRAMYFWILCGLAGLPSPGRGATHVWTGGGATGYWSDASNWQASGAPQPGEAGIVLVFASGGARLNSTNDLNGLVLDQLQFGGNHYVLNGTAALALQPGNGDSIAATGNSNRVNLPIVFQGTHSISVAEGAALAFGGRLSGPGGFTLAGGGLLAVAPAAGVDNTFQGQARVYAGILQLESGHTNDIFGTRYYAAAIPGSMVVGDAFSSAPAILSGMAMSPTTDLTLIGQGQYQVNGDMLAFGSLSGDGFVDFQGQSFKVGGNNQSTVFSGSMNGRSDAGLQKIGTGTLELSGKDTGPVFLGVMEGGLRLDGDFSQSTAIVGQSMNGGSPPRLDGNGRLSAIPSQMVR
ncbi:MAG: hypothetical protein U1F98_06235 [Verrucomicrobiota bacterium]